MQILRSPQTQWSRKTAICGLKNPQGASDVCTLKFENHYLKMSVSENNFEHLWNAHGSRCSRIWILLTLTKHCCPVDKAKFIMPLFLKRKLIFIRTTVSLEGTWSVSHKAKKAGLLSQMSRAYKWPCKGPVTSSDAGNQLLRPFSQHQTS